MIDCAAVLHSLMREKGANVLWSNMTFLHCGQNRRKCRTVFALLHCMSFYCAVKVTMLYKHKMSLEVTNHPNCKFCSYCIFSSWSNNQIHQSRNAPKIASYLQRNVRFDGTATLQEKWLPSHNFWHNHSKRFYLSVRSLFWEK